VSGNLLSFTGEFDCVKKKKWLGTKMFKASYLDKYSLEDMRFPERKTCGIRIEDGGWHFSYMGGDKNTNVVERVSNKIRSAAHQEFNNKAVLSKIGENISRKKDIFGRNSKFKRVDIDELFPEYLVNNLSLFEHLILPKDDKKRLFPWFKR
jgi:beta-1,4-mannosyl-glycoprotein beta-1,4-N-acetylglucosaminyltransferase